MTWELRWKAASWDSCENLTFFKKLHRAASNFKIF